MQYLKINSSTTLSDLNQRCGSTTVADNLLAANSVTRSRNAGQQFQNKVAEAIRNTSEPNAEAKMYLLNTVTSDGEVFERLALGDSNTWKCFASLGTFPDAAKVAEGDKIPDGSDVVGGSGQKVSNEVYASVMNSLKTTGQVDPSSFNEYSSIAPSPYLSGDEYKADSAIFSAFNLPWGKISLYSSIDDTTMDFPVYPEELSDGSKANFDTMPNLIYQYEPWYVYTGSGPRTVSYTFKFHRDMWSGNHLDGKANELIRFCKACCYPEYNGSAVIAPTVTLYINGEAHITGIMNSADDRWSGPIGLDGFYLECELTIEITEVSADPLSYTRMKNKSLIGGLSRTTASTNNTDTTSLRL